MIAIAGWDRAVILAALYNRAKVQGMGFLQARPGDMTVEQARKILNTGQSYFDYLYGRVMKIDLGGNEADTTLYNRDNGPCAAEHVMSELRERYRQDPDAFKSGRTLDGKERSDGGEEV